MSTFKMTNCYENDIIERRYRMYFKLERILA